MNIQGITFDLWDTVIHDDSDEPRRAAQGLDSKPAARRRLFHEAVRTGGPVDRARSDLAWDCMEAAFRHVWHDQHVTWTVAERVSVALGGLRATLSDAARDTLVGGLEEMEIQVMPDPVPGMVEVIPELAKRYRLAVVSDAIYSPGRCLRQWLDAHGLLGCFGGFAFSDEVGFSKPHRAMFTEAARQIGLPLESLVHVGDRDHNDVKGPQALGMEAVLFTVTRDRDREGTSAHAICDRAQDLPEIIGRLSAGENTP